jgi:FAD synthetase
MTTTVLANGTFDVLHPGHIHYLEESAALGDELIVVIARDSRAGEKKQLLMDEDDRRQVVEAVQHVDMAVLGSEESIFDTVERVQPDVITLGYDQDFDGGELEQVLKERGFEDINVIRISRGGEYASSEIKDQM